MRSFKEIKEAAERSTEESNKIKGVANLKKEFIKDINGDRDLLLYYKSDYRKHTGYGEINLALTIVAIALTVLNLFLSKTEEFNEGIPSIILLISMLSYLVFIAYTTIKYMRKNSELRDMGIILEEIDKTWDTIEWPVK